MTAVTFIHCADLHLDRPFQTSKLPPEILEDVRKSAYVSFSRLIDRAIEEKVDFFLISGDLYDLEHRSIKGQLFVKKQAERLAEAGIPLFIIHGNHDPLSETVREIKMPDHVHVFGPDTASVLYEKDGKAAARIYGFSYASRRVDENPVQSYIKTYQADAPYHIALLHGQEKMEEGHDPYAPFRLKELTETPFDYWALGHIHKRRVLHRGPAVVYPGNIQGGHKNEQGPKGGVLVTLAASEEEVTFIDTSPVDWHTVRLTIDKLTELDGLFAAAEEKIAGTVTAGKSSIIQLVITGSGTLHEYLSTPETEEEVLEELRELFGRARPFHWIGSLTVNTVPDVDREREKEQQTVLGDMICAAETFRENPSLADDALSSLYGHRTARRYMESLSPEEKKELIDQAERWLLTRIVKEDGA
ncbi:metallophosphoesterase family protein [Alteribacter natronophilus]|uniref:metallophosphoesterase family protein n=1 Tax=Alteribacter natronophilus TaxID=2583810 RepID=UPI00110D2936|nr:DNA repair exonuclease [Alteribacter natronophilus]TMW74020.1 DNA repair exonuclease [Alteribacter natronophilus]